VSLHLLAAICMAIGPVPDFLKILTFDFNKKNQDPKSSPAAGELLKNGGSHSDRVKGK
jgi:hypothetical protein